MRSILMYIARVLSAFWRSSRIFIILLLRCNLCAEIALTSATRSLYFFHRWFHWSLWYCVIAMLLLVEIIVKKKMCRLRLDCIFASSRMKTFRSTIFLMMSKQEMTWLTLVKRARINSHACLISCVQSLTWLCSVILFCSMFRWTCSKLMYVSVFKVLMFTLLNTSATWCRVWFWSVSSSYWLYERVFASDWESQLVYSQSIIWRLMIRWNELIKTLNANLESTAITCRTTELNEYLWWNSATISISFWSSQWFLSTSIKIFTLE